MLSGKEYIANRVAKELKDGDYVNLGIGIPTMVANYVSDDVHIIMEAENGILGIGPTPPEGEEDDHCTDAGGSYVTTLPGASFFDSPMSFSMVRGGHIDATVLGALEVDEQGSLASWNIPGKKVPGMGGAMDLIVGAKKVIVAMIHSNKNGATKIKDRCTLPLTASKQVNMVVTDMGVMEIENERFILKEVAPGFTVQDVQDATDAKLIIDKSLK